MIVYAGSMYFAVFVPMFLGWSYATFLMIYVVSKAMLSSVSPENLVILSRVKCHYHFCALYIAFASPCSCFVANENAL
jgi:hypothetical protein